MESLGRTTGYLFVNVRTGRRAECSLYKPDVFAKLEEFQRLHPELIEPGCEVNEEYGMQRSFRRGFDTECRNRAYSRGGTERWIIVSSTRSPWNSGNPTRDLGFKQPRVDTECCWVNLELRWRLTSQGLH
eukprot:scaffold272432_cov42-Attheya_sp.AAC.1